MEIKKVILICLMSHIAWAVSSDTVDLYLNLATEKYLQGDYQASVQSLNRVLEENSANSKAKNLFIRVVVDGATEYNLKHQYSDAMKLLKRGREVAPGNRKIEELYSITNDVLSQGKNSSEYNKLEMKEMPKPPRKLGVTEPIDIKEDTGRQVAPRLEIKAPVAILPKQVKSDNQESSGKQEVKRELLVSRNPVSQLQPVQKPVSIWLYVLFTLVIVILMLFLLMLYLKYFKMKLRMEHELQLEKNKFDLAGALEVEKRKLELQKKEMELEKLRLENKFKEEYEKKFVKMPEMPKNMPQVDKAVKINVIKNETEDLKKTIVNIAPSQNIYITDSNVEETRNRIASRMKAIYEQSPETAIAFLKDAAGNPDEGFKSNIIKALAAIASPETIEMLFKLNLESSDRIKREVIKTLKQLSKSIRNKELILPEEYKQKIEIILYEEISKGEWVF